MTALYHVISGTGAEPLSIVEMDMYADFVDDCLLPISTRI